MPSNGAFIGAAYTLTWLVLITYAVRLWRAAVRARAEHERMAARARKENEA